MIRFFRRNGYGRETIELLRDFSEYDYIHTRRAVVPASIVFYWGNNSRYSLLEDGGIEINRPENIIKAADKARFRRICMEHEIQIPKTYFRRGEIEELPVILRPKYHHGAQNLSVAETLEDLNQPWGYAQEIIDKVDEHRYFVVSGRIAWASKKIPEDKEQIAWNHSEGAVFENLRWGDWNLRAGLECLKVMSIMGLDFGGVDVIFNREGNFYLLEVNTSCAITGKYRPRCTAKCFDNIIEHFEENGEKLYFPVPTIVSNWRDLIHPKIWSRK
jgi:glutathione synthase/RimK-type ligase-like ATP-grasp enzyme